MSFTKLAIMTLALSLDVAAATADHTTATWDSGVEYKILVQLN